MAQTNIKNEILNATITVFNKKGMKFTMDDVAKEAGMSKKTIYAVMCLRLTASSCVKLRMLSEAEIFLKRL